MNEYRSGITESELYFQLRTGDQTALGIIYQRYQQKLYSMIMRSLSYDQVQSNIILLEVILQAYHEIENYQPDKIRLFTWLLQLARIKIKEHLNNKHEGDHDQYHVSTALHPLPFFKMIVIECKSVSSVSKTLKLDKVFIGQRLRKEVMQIRKHSS